MRRNFWTLIAIATFAFGCAAEVETDYGAYDEEVAQSEEGLTASPSTMQFRIQTTSRRMWVVTATNSTTPVKASGPSAVTCGDGAFDRTVCTGTTGRKGSVTSDGPDGGSCTQSGTWNCSYAAGCCTCVLSVASRSGDCNKDGSTTSLHGMAETATGLR